MRCRGATSHFLELRLAPHSQLRQEICRHLQGYDSWLLALQKDTVASTRPLVPSSRRLGCLLARHPRRLLGLRGAAAGAGAASSPWRSSSSRRSSFAGLAHFA